MKFTTLFNLPSSLLILVGIIDCYGFAPALRNVSTYDATKDLVLPIAFSRTVSRTLRNSFEPALKSKGLSNPIRFPFFSKSTLYSSINEDSSVTKNDSPDAIGTSSPKPPQILPFDPKYKTHGPIGEGEFIISREGGPTPEELSNENLLRILYLNSTDLEVNTLVWKGLGYRFDPETQQWGNSEVFPKWREKFPSPPDLIGMQRVYSREIDGPSLKSNQQLVKSIPADNKQSLKTHLKPLGFTGLKLKELTPNKTRRAQCANWLLFFREELYGYTIEELKERRAKKRAQQEAEELKKAKSNDGGKDDEWKPPIREVL